MAADSKIIDWRSTGRRKARRVLFNAKIEFKCSVCEKTTTVPPKDAPAWFDEIWPDEKRVLNPQALQADHETKDLTNNNIEDVSWKCSPCHKLADMKTEKGVSQKENNISSLL